MANSERLFQFMQAFNNNMFSLWENMNQVTMAIAVENKKFTAIHLLEHKIDKIAEAARTSKRMGKDVSALKEEYFESACKMISLRVEIMGEQYSLEEMAKHVPLNETYPDVKADLAAAGYSAVADMVTIAEKNNAPKNTQQNKNSIPPDLKK